MNDIGDSDGDEGYGGGDGKVYGKRIYKSDPVR